MPRQQTQRDRSALTRATLVSSARALFAARGYAEVATNEIVAAAEVTRGGLYYHFRDKRDLFRAVYEQVEQDLASEIARRLSQVDEDPLQMLRVGVRAFLQACTKQEVARIALIDAPSVLGWQEWREVDARYGLGLVSAGLEMAMQAGVIQRQPVKPLAHLLLGAVGEAGMMIANDEHPRAARKRIEPALVTLIEGLGQPADSPHPD